MLGLPPPLLLLLLPVAPSYVPRPIEVQASQVHVYNFRAAPAAASGGPVAVATAADPLCASYSVLLLLVLLPHRAPGTRIAVASSPPKPEILTLSRL